MRDTRKSGKIIDEDERFKQLSGERYQARVLLDGIKDGMDLFTSLARCLRGMIDKRGNNKPLLQTCAALVKSDLIFYIATDHGPKFLGGRHSSINLYPIETPFSKIKVDMDVWLDRHCGAIADKSFSNQEFLQLYADKEATHFDYQRAAEVSYFSEVSNLLMYGDKELMLNKVQQWLILVAEVFIKLSGDLLERHHNRKVGQTYLK